MEMPGVGGNAGVLLVDEYSFRRPVGAHLVVGGTKIVDQLGDLLVLRALRDPIPPARQASPRLQNPGHFHEEQLEVEPGGTAEAGAYQD